MSYFKQLWKKDIVPKPVLNASNPDIPLKVAVIRGHDSNEQGADNFEGLSEYRYWEQTLAMVGGKHEVKEFTRDDGGIRNACRHAGAWGADVIIECHFNNYNGTVEGCEALYSSHYKLAKSFCDMMEDMGRVNRGPKKVDGKDSGAYNIKCAEMYANRAILIEPFFGDNPNDYIEPSIMATALTQFINTL